MKPWTRFEGLIGIALGVLLFIAGVGAGMHIDHAGAAAPQASLEPCQDEGCEVVGRTITVNGSDITYSPLDSPSVVFNLQFSAYEHPLMYTLTRPDDCFRLAWTYPGYSKVFATFKGLQLLDCQTHQPLNRTAMKVTIYDGTGNVISSFGDGGGTASSFGQPLPTRSSNEDYIGLNTGKGLK